MDISDRFKTIAKDRQEQRKLPIKKTQSSFKTDKRLDRFKVKNVEYYVFIRDASLLQVLPEKHIFR